MCQFFLLFVNFYVFLYFLLLWYLGSLRLSNGTGQESPPGDTCLRVNGVDDSVATSVSRFYVYVYTTILCYIDISC